MRFSKWHALGNRYLLVEPDDERLTAERVRELAVASDGVVEVVAATRDAVDVVIWNTDGSTAELSGNGTRIAARWLADRTGAERVRVRVGEREVTARMRGDALVEQDLGPVDVGGPETVAGVEIVPVSVGNPHAVVRGDPGEITRLGPLLETHPRFPQRTNVQVVRVDEPGRVTARVWERGVGETPASGTSAVAVAAATHREGEVRVRFPGGELDVRLDAGRAYLTGPAAPLRVPRQVLVYVRRGGDFLLLRRRADLGGFWQGITGAPEWGESDEEAARRELYEDTGLVAQPRPVGFGYVLRPSDEAGWFALYGPGVAEVPEDVYVADAAPGWEPTLGPEHVEWCWCAPAEAVALLHCDDNRRALEAASRFTSAD